MPPLQLHVLIGAARNNIKSATVQTSWLDVICLSLYAIWLRIVCNVSIWNMGGGYKKQRNKIQATHTFLLFISTNQYFRIINKTKMDKEWNVQAKITVKAVNRERAKKKYATSRRDGRQRRKEASCWTWERKEWCTTGRNEEKYGSERRQQTVPTYIRDGS